MRVIYDDASGNNAMSWDRTRAQPPTPMCLGLHHSGLAKEKRPI